MMRLWILRRKTWNNMSGLHTADSVGEESKRRIQSAVKNKRSKIGFDY